MSLAELRDYIKQHRKDDRSLHELFVNRRNPNAKQYLAPLDEESKKIMEEAIKRKINEQQHSS